MTRTLHTHLCKRFISACQMLPELAAVMAIGMVCEEEAERSDAAPLAMACTMAGPLGMCMPVACVRLVGVLVHRCV